MNEELKKQLENAKTEEETKELLKNAKVELTDDEMGNVAGGKRPKRN